MEIQDKQSYSYEVAPIMAIYTYLVLETSSISFFIYLFTSDNRLVEERQLS